MKYLGIKNFFKYYPLIFLKIIFVYFNYNYHNIIY